MRRTRTHTHDRLFFGNSTQTSPPGRFLAGLGEAFLPGLIGIFVLGFLTARDGAALRAGSPFSEDHPFQRARRPLSAEEREAGIVRGEGRVEAGVPGAIGPLCAVVQNSSSGKSTYEGYRGVITSGGAVEVGGERLALDASVIRRLTFVPERLKAVSERVEPRIREIASEIPAGGGIAMQCAAAGDAVYVEGCRLETAGGEPALGACPEALLHVARGGAEAQIDAAASSLAGGVAALAAMALAVLLCASSLFGPKPIVEVLARRAAVPPPSGAGKAYALLWVPPLLAMLGLGLAPLVLPLGSPALDVPRFPYVLALAALSLALTLALFALRRRRQILAATEPVRRTPTSPLAQASGREVELALRVRRDADTKPGPLTGEPRAFAWLTIDELVTTGSGKRRGTRETNVHDRFDPHELPVEDASGKGTLVLWSTDLDLRAVEHFVNARRGEDQHPLTRDLPRSIGHDGFLVRENYLEPGESLYVLGPVARVQREEAQGAAYRQAPANDARIESKEGERLLVYGGTEASLLGEAARARRHATLLLGASSAVAGFVAVALAWLAAQ